MTCILPNIDSLDQHLSLLNNNRDAYRPEACPCCGFGVLHIHGNYYRKSDREGKNGIYFDLIPIPRFRCVGCNTTCSCLPSCIPPYRWYLWSIQQAILLRLLVGIPVHQIEKLYLPSRHTIRRWNHWISSRFAVHKFHLCSLFYELGRYMSLPDFWLAYFKQRPLDSAMLVAHQAGELIHKNGGIIS